ncbi:MAG: hypothetical protein GWN80_02060, partial [Gammaproteobacteria bacterium]|nr:hypothetical protein [Gammaproteobacteria bacterium]
AEQAKLGVASAAEFIDAGRWITEFPDVEVYIERKDGEHLRNIRVYDVRNPDVSREIRASSGRIQTSETSSSITVELQD